MNHVTKLHAEWYNALIGNGNKSDRQTKQTKVTDSIASGFSQEKFEEYLCGFWVTEDLPFEDIENPYFQNLIKLLNPRAKLFKRQTLRAKCWKMYEGKKATKKEKIKKMKGKINFSQDLWTASNGESFMAIIGHTLSEDWRLESTMLDFCPITGSHSGDRITQTFTATIFDDYEISCDRLGCIIQDNASSNDKFISNMVSKYDFDEDKLIRCFPHIQNRGVQDALACLKDIIELLRHGLIHIRCSPKAMAKFKSNCELIAKNYFLKPPIDCKTRWDSTYDMIVTALKLEKALRVSELDYIYRSIV